MVEQVVANLKSQGYLDDAAFAHEWRSNRERNRPRGQGLLRQELLRLGVAPDVVREALEDFDAGENAYRAGLNLVSRLAGTDYSEFRRRVWAHLQRRGFEAAAISEAVQRLWRELADPLHRDVDACQKEQ